jgi:hypothetical protein
VRARLPVKKKEKRSPPHTRVLLEKKKHVEARTKRREGGTKAREILFTVLRIFCVCSFLPFFSRKFVWQGPFLFSRIQKKLRDATEKTKHTKAYQHIQK